MTDLIQFIRLCPWMMSVDKVIGDKLSNELHVEVDSVSSLNDIDPTRNR